MISRFPKSADVPKDGSGSVDTMVLRSLLIQSLGAVDRFGYDFESGMNLIGSRHTDEIAYAIRLVLGHRVSSLPACRVREDTRIEARVCVAETEYRVMAKKASGHPKLCLRALGADGKDLTKEYFYRISHCAEQDLSDVFCGRADQALFRLLQYLDEDRYYTSQELSMRTERLSETKTFRAYLKAFIKTFQTEPIREGKRYELSLEGNGRYTVRYKDENDRPVLLSESEQTLFRYLCFLRTAEFWRGFEELRNLHSIKKPLIVAGFLERLDEGIDITDLLQRTLHLGRQVILLTDKEKNDGLLFGNGPCAEGGLRRPKLSRV
ncbi:MAG: hypothetical protein IJW29_08325 [Clostridia bacterium]|nr:hypothetical protein [Clostridia bacterium]